MKLLELTMNVIIMFMGMIAMILTICTEIGTKAHDYALTALAIFAFCCSIQKKRDF